MHYRYDFDRDPAFPRRQVWRKPLIDDIDTWLDRHHRLEDLPLAHGVELAEDPGTLGRRGDAYGVAMRVIAIEVTAPEASV